MGKKNTFYSPEAPKFKEYMGKTPPNDKDLEEAVLGALLVDKNVISTLVDILQEDSFYDERHRVVYRAMLRLFEKGNPIDILTVAQELRQMGDLEKVGGAYYLTELANRVASAANVEYHSRIVLQKFVGRELINISATCIDDAFDPKTDILELLDRIQRQISEIHKKLLNDSDKEASVCDIVCDILNKKVPTECFEIYHSQISEVWEAIYPEDITFLAARPGVGKTSFSLQLLYNFAQKGIKCAFLSLEMKPEMLAARIVMQTVPGVSFKNLRKNDLSEEEKEVISEFFNNAGNVPLSIQLQKNKSAESVMTSLKSLAESGHKVIALDYLQLVKLKGANTIETIEHVSYRIKEEICNKYGVSVICLAQYNASKTNIAGGDGAMWSADTVVAMFETCTDARFSEIIREISIDEEHAKTFVTFEVQKQRYGDTGHRHVQFNKKTSSFNNPNPFLISYDGMLENQ